MRTMRTNHTLKDSYNSSNQHLPIENNSLDYVPFSERRNIHDLKKAKKEKNSYSRAGQAPIYSGHSFANETSLEANYSTLQKPEHGELVMPRRGELYDSYHYPLGVPGIEQADTGYDWQRAAYFKETGRHNDQESMPQNGALFYEPALRYVNPELETHYERSSDGSSACSIWQSRTMVDTLSTLREDGFVKPSDETWRLQYCYGAPETDMSGALHVSYLRQGSLNLQYNNVTGDCSSSSSSDSSDNSAQTDASELSPDVSVDNSGRPALGFASERTYPTLSSWAHFNQPPGTIADSESTSENVYSSATAFTLPIQSSETLLPMEDNHDDAEADQARTHPLYFDPELKDDGMFHCPFENEQACGHQPTKLKCNYDKYVDSHLKPHRCKAPECSDLRFSSTACRLRHEREAHGSHGHGKKPFLCVYLDCDRSKPGNGFPRAWNCNDHMKRVHGHESASGSEQNDSPERRATSPPEAVVAGPPSTTRKRSTRGTGKPDKEKRARLEAPESSGNLLHKFKDKPYEEVKTELTEEWLGLWKVLHDSIHRIRGPLDFEEQKILEDGIAKLVSNGEACEQLRRLRNEEQGTASPAQP